MKTLLCTLCMVFFTSLLVGQSYLRTTLSGTRIGVMPEIDPNANQSFYLIRGLQDVSIAFTHLLNERNAISGSLHYAGSKSEVRTRTYRWPSEFVNGEYVLDSTLLHSYISIERIDYLGIGAHHNFLLFQSFENFSIQSSLIVLFNTNNERRIGRSESNFRNYVWEETTQTDNYNSIIPVIKIGLNYSYRLGKIFKLRFLNRIGIELSFGASYAMRDLRKDQANVKQIARGGSLGFNFRLDDFY